MKPDNKKQNEITLVKTVEETVDTRSFFFSHPETGRLSFKPGQFINIGVHIDGKSHYRAYSISSLPEDDLIQLTIKRVSGGLVSNWMIDHLHAEDQVSTHGVAGVFNILDQPPGRNVLFISAGCGITPVMSMARYLLVHQKDRIESIQFIHRARNASHIIYDDEIMALGRENPLFEPFFYLSDASGTDNPSIYRKGALNRSSLKSHLQDREDTSVYLCGPPGFMAMVEEELMAAGFDPARLFQEDFTPLSQNLSGTEDALHHNVICHDETLNSYTVTLPEFGFSREAEEGESLLKVLQDGNVPIIAACGYGVCGSCKCKVESGKVEMTVDPVVTGVLSQEEVDQGYTLACSSLIVDDVEVSLK